MLRCLFFAGLFMASLTGKPQQSGNDEWAGPRGRMLASIADDVARNPQVLGRGALSAPVLAAMAAVPRHEFVPADLQRMAYANQALPIGQGQTISQPTIVAMMTDILDLKPEHRVFEVGTGSGYQAAVLSAVVTRGEVHSIEIVPELARSARERLRRLGYSNVRVYQGDGYGGRPDLAPFDAIIITAAAEDIPAPLIEQLKPGGVLVMPVGGVDDTQWLTVLRKNAKGEVSRRVVLPVRFVPLTREEEQ